MAWPSRVNADGKSKAAVRQSSELATKAGAPRNVALSSNQSKVGELVVSAALAESDATPGKRVVHLVCRNPTDQKISGKLEIQLTRTKGVGMERVMPMPQIAWRHLESVEVEAGETLLRDVSLPKDIGGEVARIDKARERAEHSDALSYPRVFYGVMAMPAGSASTRPKFGKIGYSKASLAMAPSGPDFGY